MNIAKDDFQKKIDEALHIITELRNTWAQAFNLEEKSDAVASEQK